MKYKLLAAVIVLIFAVGVWMVGSEAVVSDISQGIVRLHILANSDSEEDQRLKLAVRDRLLKEVRERGGEGEEGYFKMSLSEVISLSQKVIKEQGFDYGVHAERGRFYFPTKHYENIVLPAGEYEAVRIVIGEGAGKNWWCVMYPPLCFTNETRGSLSGEEMAQLESVMSKGCFRMIQTDGEQIAIKPAFKLVEWWQEAKHALWDN